MSKTQLKKQLVYKTCSELPLMVFFKIAESGDVNLLVIKGEFEKSELLDIWEDILLEYSRLDNNMALTNVMDQKEELFKQAALFCEIKAMLLYLLGAYKEEYVDRLNQLGYKIDKDHLVESIKRNDQKSNNISTRMKMIQKDLESVDNNKKSSFDAVMAWMSSELGFEPKEDITVSRYCEYRKVIKAKKKKK